MNTKAKTKDFAKVLKSRLARDAELAAQVRDESLNVDIGELIYRAMKIDSRVGMAGLVLAGLTWLGSVEYRLARSQQIESLVGRVLSLEEMLMPVIVDYRVREAINIAGFAGEDPAPVEEYQETARADVEHEFEEFPQVQQQKGWSQEK